MKIRTTNGWVIPVVLLFVLVAVGHTQSGLQEYTLNVNGQSGSAKVVQVNGHSYVDVDALARIANGSIAYQGNQITLNLPNVGGSGAAAPAAAPANPPANNGFSKDFLNAGIEYMTEIREWRNTLVNAIANGFSLSDALFVPYRQQSATSLRLTNLATNTEADRNAAKLLANELENMRTLTSKYLTMRANLEFIAPDALTSDPMDQKILTCAKSLAAMASSNQFMDDGSCH